VTNRLYVVIAHGGSHCFLRTGDQLALEIADIGHDHIREVHAFESIEHLNIWTETE
jgi:hypothetical protein